MAKTFKSVGATPTEVKIYKIALDLFKKTKKPFMNHHIATIHKTHRTNIRQHLASMVKKGLVSRWSHQLYVPNKGFK